MADKNLKVNLIANTSKFKSAMSASSSQIKLLNSEFKNAAAETDKYGNKVDATGAKQKQLSGIVEQHRLRIKAIKEEQRHWTNELKQGNITEEQHAKKQQELANRLNNTEAQMKSYEGQLKRMNAEGKTATRTYADFDKQFRNVGTTMRNVGAKVGITAGIGFMAMKRVLGDVVGEAMSFQSQMSEVKAISGATGSQMEKLTKQSKDLGRATKFTAQEAASSQAELARAGFEVNEIYDAMPGLLDLAASSNMDLSTSAKITSNIIRGFNKNAKESGHIADVLAKGAATANQDVEGLGRSMETAAPVANSLNISFESVAAATGKMADAGISGEKAGRMLRQGMLRLSKPTGQAAKVIDELGINVFDAKGNMKSMDGIVGELEKGLKGQSKQAKAAALATIFGSESTAGWTVLLDKGSGALKDYTGELENSDGAAKDMADTMIDNAEGAITIMKSALSGMKIELGEKLLPVLTDAAHFVTDLADSFNEMDDSTVQTIAQVAGLVTAVLGVTTVVAGLVTGIGALMAFAGPVGLAITGGTLLLTGLAAAIYANKKRTEQLKEEQEKAKTEALRYGDNLSAGTKKGVKGYTDLYEGAKLKMLDLKRMSGDEAKKTSSEVVKAFSEMANKVIAELETQKEKMANAINDVYAIAGDAGKDAAKKMTNEVIKKFDKDIGEYKEALDTVKEAHKKYNNDLSKMPAEFASKYQEALKVMEGGSKEFAKNQEEIASIQKAISDKQGKIMYDGAQGYIEKTNKVYDKSLKAANDWYVKKSKVFKQALDQGRITQEQYDTLMSGTQARANEMMALASQEYNKTTQELSKHLDDRGKLIDIKTGEEFEKQKEYVGGMNGYLIEVEESQDAYLERWKKHTAEVISTSADFSKRSKDAYVKDLQAFLETTGMTKEAAAKSAKETVEEVLNNLDKGKDKAKKSGKDKGTAHKDGIESTKDANKKAADNVEKATDGALKQGKDKANQHGKDKGTRHKQGLDSTKDANKGAAASIEKETDNALGQGKNSAKTHGEEKGQAHKRGLADTKGSNLVTSKDISDSVSSYLGKTTDGGGGSKAGKQFRDGLYNWRSLVNTAGAGVARNGKAGLQSVSTSSAGDGFVSGFRNSIARGNVWNAAWNLGKKALSALKKSIDSHSPSKETGKEGRNFTAGFNNAIARGNKETARNASLMGAKAVTSLAKSVTAKKKAAADAAKAVQKAFKTAMDKADYKFKIGKIDSSKYISELRKVRSEYAKTPEQVRKVNLQIKKIEDQRAKDRKKIAKQAETLRKKQFSAALKLIKDKASANKISNSEELKQLQTLAKKYKKNSNERLQIDKEIATVQKRLQKEQADAIKARFDKEKALIDRKKKLNELSLADELKAYEGYLKTYKKGSEQRKYWEEQVYDVKKRINDQLVSINDEYAKKMQDINQKLIGDEEKLRDEYQKTLDNRTQALYSFAGIFDEIQEKEAVSGQQLINNLKGQVDTFEDWANNIKVLANRGIDEGLLEELRDMGPKAAEEIAALNGLTDEQLTQYVELWQKKNEMAKRQAINELGDMRYEMDGQMEALRQEAEHQLESLRKEWLSRIKAIRVGTKKEFNPMKSDLKTIGEQSMQGMINGLESMRGELMAKARSLADAVRAEMQAALDIHSPSRVMRDDVGKQVPAGVAIGIEDNILAVKRSMQKVKKVFMAEVAGFKSDFGKLAFSLDQNKSKFKVDHEVKHSGLEDKLDKLIDLLSAGVMNKDKDKLSIYQENHYHNTGPLSPAESARKNKQMLRRAVMDW